MKLPLLDMTLDQLRARLEEIPAPAYRADQLADWVYRKGATDPATMTNIPADLRDRVTILTSRVAAQAQSSDGSLKLLVEYEDGQQVETVLIPTDNRVTACLSTQAGCAMGCRFCASAAGGWARNLTAGEILQQVLHLQKVSGQRVNHVVFMGMGEPLANYNATLAAVRALIDPQRFGLSARSVTISTVGLPAGIRRLAREDLPITLAISLHAPNDPLRRELIPAAESVTIDEIIDAATEFFDARKREVTLEYLLIADVNDSALCAEGLANIARRLRCNVNLIIYNPVADLPFRQPGVEGAKAFLERLRKRGVNAHLRKSRGADIAAACGQLRRQRQNQEPGTGE
ncbi:MAG: 23S rRNA (adenine(2503)-C(2))-methyltransferase RlmN [Phycisphaerae bacterium]|jgi:23S rRNA (adenine2503-C2)-methyltransferase